MRKKIAVATGVASFGIFFFGLDVVADALGVPLFIDGESSGVGVCIVIASMMLAWRIYHWVASGKINGNLTKETQVSWFFWLLGMFAYISVATLIVQLDISTTLQRIAMLGSIVGIAWFAYTKHGAAMRKIRADSDLPE